MISRRGFLLGLLAIPACAEDLKIPCQLQSAKDGQSKFKPEDWDQAKRIGELVNDLLADLDDMVKGIRNLVRPKEEDHLYAKIQSTRKW